MVLGGLAFLGLAQRRFETWQVRYGFQFHLEIWVQWMVLAVIGGAAFGLATWPPVRGVSRYRWMVALALGAIPLLLLLHAMAFLAWPGRLPGFLDRSYSRLGLGPQFAAVVLGMAIAAGFAPRTEGQGEATKDGLDAS